MTHLIVQTPNRVVKWFIAKPENYNTSKTKLKINIWKCHLRPNKASRCNAGGGEGKIWEVFCRLVANEKPWAGFQKILEKNSKECWFPTSSPPFRRQKWGRTNRWPRRIKSDDHAYLCELGKCKDVAVLASCYRQFTSCKITCKQGTPFPSQARSSHANTCYRIISFLICKIVFVMISSPSWKYL